MAKLKITRQGDSWKLETMPAAPPRDYEEDEKCAAEALLMLANSGGGFLTLSSSTTTTAAKKRQDQPLKIPAPPAQKEMSYTCNVCGKTFGSYQALGGHKTSHRPAPAAANAVSCGGIHECSVCHETFPSGQALGGHMSKHLEGRKSNGAACKRRRVTSSGGCPDAGRAPVFVLDFDLNEMPAPELSSDEEVIELYKY